MIGLTTNAEDEMHDDTAMGGLVVDAAGVSAMWMLAVACCGAGLILHKTLTREVQP